MDLESFIAFNDECSTSSKILVEEKTENSEFSNSVLKILSAEKQENMVSVLEPSSLAKKDMK